MIRSSAVSLALGYVVLGLLALVLFAAPLWYAWQGTIQEGRAEILSADAQRLAGLSVRRAVDKDIQSVNLSMVTLWESETMKRVAT